jgi:hypothetical protein
VDSSTEQPKVNGHSPAAAAAAAAEAPLGAVVGGDSSSGGAVPGAPVLGCQGCGEQLVGIDAARAHAAATGHVEFAELD